MAPTNTGVRLTPLAALLDTLTTATMHRSLGTYLAVARTPGTDWKSFDEIAADLTAMLAGARTLNRVSVKTFADSYGIPDTRYVDGRTMPRPVPDTAINAYVAALTEADHPAVDRMVVIREATEAQDRARDAQADADDAQV